MAASATLLRFFKGDGRLHRSDLLAPTFPASRQRPAREPDSRLRYRPEIDGLRAVAVLAVALFHCGFDAFRGGFVGVDIFFVISGYLITSLILDGLRADRFSLVGFYERRARRILPALFLVMAASALFGFAWMLPKDFESFGKSLVATILFASNIWELHAGGYWALPAQFKPLLHTWSLSLEEQFYLVYPLLLMLLWSFARRHMAWWLLALAIVSLALAQVGVILDRQAAFYLLPTRAWEFLLGALAAVCPRDAVAGERRAQWLGAAGLAMILAAIGLFSRHVPTPGVATLLPTGGTALVLLFATERTYAGRALAAPPLVAIGLTSYSLYLWHYPVFAFARIYAVGTPSPRVLALLLVATMPVAWLSWRFVETPFRSRAAVARGVVFGGAALASLAFLACGLFLFEKQGLPSRLYQNDIGPVDDLYITYNEGAFRFKATAFDRPGTLRVLVVGNSFARDFINMTVETFDLRKVQIVYRDDLGSCLATWRRPMAVSLLAQADVVVLASRSLDLGCVEANLAIAAAQGKKLFYVGTKYFGVNLNWLMRLAPAERANRTNPLPADILRQEARMAGLVPPDHYISLLAPIVKDGAVPITDAQGRLISPDRTHVTRYGAQLIGRKALEDSPYGVLFKSF